MREKYVYFFFAFLDLFIEIFVFSSEYTAVVPKLTSVFGVLAHENNKKNGDTEKAFECFSKIVKFAPNCFEVLYAYGESLIYVGKLQEAFQFLIDLLKKFNYNLYVMS